MSRRHPNAQDVPDRFVGESETLRWGRSKPSLGNSRTPAREHHPLRKGKRLTPCTGHSGLQEPRRGDKIKDGGKLRAAPGKSIQQSQAPKVAAEGGSTAKPGLMGSRTQASLHGPKVTLPFPQRSGYLPPQGQATFPSKVRLPFAQRSGYFPLRKVFVGVLHLMSDTSRNPSSNIDSISCSKVRTSPST